MVEKFSIGQPHRLLFAIDASMLEEFARFSGDHNPIHIDVDEARAYGFPRQVAHGALLTAFLSRIIGTAVPGPGAVWMRHSAEWLAPVYVGDEIELVVTVERASAAAGVLSLAVVAKNQKSETVMKGDATVKVSEKLTGTVSNPTSPRVALITGGSRGIGSAVARRLARAGLRIAINYRHSGDAAKRAVNDIESDGGVAQAFAADISDSDATATMVAAVLRSFGQIDVLVHAATPSIQAIDVATMKYGDMEPYLKTYLGGALALGAAVTPGMVDRHFGRLIFFGTSSLFGVPPMGLAAYISAKHALAGLVRCLATELGPKGITTNMVSPGMTVTDLVRYIPGIIKEVEARKSPMRRLSTPQDTAELVSFLVSDGAGFINGANLPVTGGPL